MIQTKSGTKYRRNRVHVRPCNSSDGESGNFDEYDYVPPNCIFSDRETSANSARRSTSYNNVQTSSPNHRSQRTRRQPVWFGDYQI